jgi:hypothetical protein
LLTSENLPRAVGKISNSIANSRRSTVIQV